LVFSCPGFEAELRKEIGDRHLLFGEEFIAIAKRQNQDDVLFLLSDGRLAEVHLTGQGRRENDPRWPRTLFYSTAQVWVERRMQPDHAEMNELS